MLETLSDFVDVLAVMRSVEQASYPPSAAPEPFTPSDDDPFRAEVALPQWTIDDTAWLAEVVCMACRRASAIADIQVAVRLAAG